MIKHFSILGVVVLGFTAVVSAGEAESAQESVASRVPTQVWQAEDVLCPLDPSRDWGKQLPYPEDKSGQDLLSEPTLVSDWDLPATDLMDPTHRKPIVLEAIVNPSGRVERIGVLKGNGLAYSAALVETMKEIEFKPATWDGQPICFTYVFVARPHPR